MLAKKVKAANASPDRTVSQEAFDPGCISLTVTC